MSCTADLLRFKCVLIVLAPDQRVKRGGVDPPLASRTIGGDKSMIVDDYLAGRQHVCIHTEAQIHCCCCWCKRQVLSAPADRQRHPDSSQQSVTHRIIISL